MSVKPSLPSVPSLIDDFRLSDLYTHCSAQKFICGLIVKGNGMVVQRLVTDRLVRKGFDLVVNPDPRDYYDCTINDIDVEIRRANIRGARLYLYMGVTNGVGQTEYKTRKEKVTKLMTGGYLMVRITNEGNRLLMYYFPTVDLVREFGKDCYSSSGININRLNKSFGLNIPIVEINH